VEPSVRRLHHRRHQSVTVEEGLNTNLDDFLQQFGDDWKVRYRPVILLLTSVQPVLLQERPNYGLLKLLWETASGEGFVKQQADEG